MLFLHSLFMGLVAQGHCLQLPSLGKSAQVPHPGVVSGCPQPMRLQSMPLSLITVKKQPGSGSLCLWSPWDETTAGTLALESPVSPPWHVLVPWRAPLHGGRTWSGGGWFSILWLLSCPWGDPHWPSLSIPGDRAAVEARRPLLNLPVMERAGLKGVETCFPAWSLCPRVCGFQSEHHWLRIKLCTTSWDLRAQEGSNFPSSGEFSFEPFEPNGQQLFLEAQPQNGP